MKPQHKPNYFFIISAALLLIFWGIGISGAFFLDATSKSPKIGAAILVTFCGIGAYVLYGLYKGFGKAKEKPVFYWIGSGALIGLVLLGLAYVLLMPTSNQGTQANTQPQTPPPQPQPYCGDGKCSTQETCSSCSADCGKCAPPKPTHYCGDGYCNSAESCTSCSADCGKCKSEILEDMQKTIVWVKYEYEGRNADGTPFSISTSGSGVIVGNDDNELTIYTNRHVIDCGRGENPCYQRTSEKVTIRTKQDGKTYPAYQVSVAPHNLDIAILKVKTSNAKNYQVAYSTDQVNIGDKVTAIGYPAYAERVVEFSVADGQITALKDLLMDDGYPFASIESNAYTYFGNSGGGLFNENGQLIGINTWINSQNSIGIRLSSLKDIDTFNYCKEGYMREGKCYPYCSKEEIMGADGSCYGICDQFYCRTTPPYANDNRCQNPAYVYGNDGRCHYPCGGSNRYCEEGSYCYRNQCVSSCQQIGTYLYEDGRCYSLG